MGNKSQHPRCACITTKGTPCRQAGRHWLADGRPVCSCHWALLRQGMALTFRPGAAK